MANIETNFNSVIGEFLLFIVFVFSATTTDERATIKAVGQTNRWRRTVAAESFVVCVWRIFAANDGSSSFVRSFPPLPLCWPERFSLKRTLLATREDSPSSSSTMSDGFHEKRIGGDAVHFLSSSLAGRQLSSQRGGFCCCFLHSLEQQQQRKAEERAKVSSGG